MYLRTCAASAASLMALVLAAMVGCSSSSDSPQGTAGSGGSAGQAGASGQAGSAGNAGQQDGGADSSAGQGGSAGTQSDAGPDAPDTNPVPCPTTFRFVPADSSPSTVQIAGEWNSFNLASATTMTRQPDGSFTATVDLLPGLHAYKLVLNGSDWQLDPGQGRRKYLGGTENSAIKVADCRMPSFAVQSSAASRPSQGNGTYQAKVQYKDGIEGSGADGAHFSAVLEHNGEERALSGSEWSYDAGSGQGTVSLSGLEDGKYRVKLMAQSTNGRVGEPLRLVFWVEAEAFSWKDALVYMVMTDRYKDGDPSNNQTAPTPEAEASADFKGGDLQGLTQSIANGDLDRLGIRAIWLTPFQTNPAEAYLAADHVHKVTGYHGYWPIKARQVEPRIGGEAGLHALVKEAHKHGIRILQDYVLNHVHQKHEYVSAHPDWFRTGCVCGTEGCDWTAHALDCMFADYMPDINHTVPEANAAFVADAVWWLDTFDLDGLRVDAVKHVEEVATRNLAAEVRETFEPAGTRYFLMGETAMGWSDCDGNDPNCNANDYGTISKYIGPFGLDGQFDFVLYHGVSYRTFAYSDKGMLHADFWAANSQRRYPQGAVMTPYIGSHDTARFASLANYRGQDASHDRGIPGNQWSNAAQAPTDQEPYQRTRLAMTWLLGLPGAPLMYYGDEYGQWGGSDPNNRSMWRPESALSDAEKATLQFVQKLGTVRQSVPALRRGDYVQLSGVTEDQLIFGRRIAPGNAAIVALSRSATTQSVSSEVTSTLGLNAGAVLHDRLGGPDVTVQTGGRVTVVIPAKGAVILTP